MTNVTINKYVLQRKNGSWQPGDNYIRGTVKYDGHTININDWGPFDASNSWSAYSDLKSKKRSVTFNYNGGKNPDYQDAPMTVTFYDDNNPKDNDISEVFSEQPWWTASHFGIHIVRGCQYHSYNNAILLDPLGCCDAAPYLFISEESNREGGVRSTTGVRVFYSLYCASVLAKII